MSHSAPDEKPAVAVVATPAPTPEAPTEVAPVLPEEIGGAKGLEPTRYGDWERNGRCTDF